MFPSSPFLGANDPQLLPLMQRKMMAPGMIPGPTPGFMPQPGFRAPNAPQEPGMSWPQEQQGGDMLGAGMIGLGGALRGYKNPNAGVTPGVPQGADPTGNAGPAYLGGSSPLGPVDPQQQTASWWPDFLRKLGLAPGMGSSAVGGGVFP